MKYFMLLFHLFTFLFAYGQNTEKDLPEKSIYQVVKDEYTVSLKTLALKGNIKTIIEEYKNANVNDTIIDFSNYELTNSNIEKEPWFISPNITKFYKATFNKKGYNTNSISCLFNSNDSIFIEYKYDKNNLPIIKNEHEIHYQKSFDEMISQSYQNNIKYIYDSNKNLIRIEHEDGSLLISFAYNPHKMQIEEVSEDLQETDALKTNIKTYDKYGLLLSDQSYDDHNKKGNLWTYEYDKTGRVIKEKLLTKEGKEHIYKKRKTDTTVKIYRLYDKNDNCIERITLHKNGKLAIRKLTIEYFEE